MPRARLLALSAFVALLLPPAAPPAKPPGPTAKPAGTAAKPSGTAARSRGPDRCLAALHRGYDRVAEAERRTVQACLWLATAHHAPSLAGCVDGDRFGAVGRARRLALAEEARACPAGAPRPVGATDAAHASDEAVAAGRALLFGLLGRSPDEAIAPLDGRSGAFRCQRRVLAAAGRCARSFVDDYQRCAEAAVRDGADDPFALVACKGSDRRGRLSQACDAGIANAVASCGDGAEALFPGCAGDLAACVRAHARGSASRSLNGAAGLCQDVLVGSLPEPTLLQCFEPPPLEPIVYTPVPVPDGVNPSSPEWDEDGEHLIFSFTAPDVTGTQLASMRPDGSEFRCLTCGSAISGNLRPVQRFRDGRRVLVAGPNNPNARWRVLECTPSVADCRSSLLLPIELPPNPDPTTPVLQYRVPHVTFDDAWLIWTEVRLRGPGGVLSAMGRLARETDRYVVRDARVIAPPLRSLDLGDDSDLWRNFTQPFEAKEAAMRGGLDWVEAGTPDAGHYDDFAIDLTSGAVRRMSRYPDHNEGVSFTADEQWAVISSARTDGRVEFLGLLPRPPYLEWIAFSTHFVAIAGAPSDGISPGGNPDERDCYLDPWLIDRWFARGDYIGQRLLRPADGWASTAGGFSWSPDGTRLTLVEERWKRLTPPGEHQATRMTIASFPARAPIAPEAVVPVVPTPEPTWAIRYEDYLVPDTSGLTVLPGKASGTATIRNDMPTTLAGELEVVYDDYSDDGRSVLDGYERFRIPSLILQGAEYEVDLTLRGEHQGSMRGALVYDFVNEVNSGEVASELDGRVVTGPHTCYEAGLIPVP